MKAGISDPPTDELSFCLGDGVSRSVGEAARHLVEDLLLRRILMSTGAEAGRLKAAFEELGLVSAYLAQLERRGWWHRARAAENLGLAGAARA